MIRASWRSRGAHKYGYQTQNVNRKPDPDFLSPVLLTQVAPDLISVSRWSLRFLGRKQTPSKFKKPLPLAVDWMFLFLFPFLFS
jgi:hypothetical protein